MIRPLSFRGASQARLVALILALGLVGGRAAILLAAPAAGPAPTRPNIVLITVDSLRWDRLGCYTGGRKSTPAIDSLAARGIRFTRAYAASPSTAASTATILTGLYPIRHGVRDDVSGRVRDEVPVLAELLKKAGFSTAGVIGTGRLDGTTGLNRGFDAYEDVIPRSVQTIVAYVRWRRAEDGVSKALKILDEAKAGAPFFLWLDLYDPHYEYDPPDPFKKDYEKDPYQGEIAYVDKQVGTLLDELKKRGHAADSLMILAGSHGEGLGDHQETGHGDYLYETTIRVPLIIVPPGGAGDGARGGRVADQPVGLVDLLPTILEVVRAPIPAGLDGRSIAPVFLAKTEENRRTSAVKERRLFVEAADPYFAYGWSPLFSVIEGDRKVVDGKRLQAFDLKTDPAETKPITPVPAWAAELQSFGRPLLGQLDPPQEERKKILAEAAALALPWSDKPYCVPKENWPDPRDETDLNDRLFRARAQFDKGFVGRSYTLSLEVLETDPTNFIALDEVAFLALRNGWKDYFMERIELMQCDYPYRGTPYHYWAHFLEKAKDPAGAEKAFKVFTRLEPRSDEPYHDLAAFYAAQGKKDLAFENLAKAISLGDDDFEQIRKDPRLLSLADDPRYARLLHAPPAPAQAK